MHQNAFDGQALPGPAGPQLGELDPRAESSWIKGEAMEGRGRGRKERGRTPQCLTCVDAPADNSALYTGHCLLKYKLDRDMTYGRQQLL